MTVYRNEFVKNHGELLFTYFGICVVVRREVPLNRNVVNQIIYDRTGNMHSFFDRLVLFSSLKAQGYACTPFETARPMFLAVAVKPRTAELFSSLLPL